MLPNNKNVLNTHFLLPILSQSLKNEFLRYKKFIQEKELDNL